MELNYEKRYAYAELETILKWLGQSYMDRVPAKILKIIKQEKKFGYFPKIDFTKPIEEQIRQETKNYFAYLALNYFIENEEEKRQVKEAIQANAKRKASLRKIEREKEIRQKAQVNQPSLTMSIDEALKKI